jgi:Lipocalin-like domain
MLAYAGRYRADGNTIVISVDVAWDESRIRSEQVRHYQLDGDRLHIEAAPQAYANFGGRILRGLLVWRRAA